VPALTHKLLDREHTELVITGKVDTGNGSKYAYRFSDSRADGERFKRGGSSQNASSACGLTKTWTYEFAL
jgi:hypothetical protein